MRNDQGSHLPERHSDRAQTPFIKFLADFEQRSMELSGYKPSQVARSCERIVVLEQDIKVIEAFTTEYDLDTVTDMDSLFERHLRIFTEVRHGINESDEGRERVFQQMLRFKSILHNGLPGEVNRYLLLKEAMAERFPDKTIYDLTKEEFDQLDQINQKFYQQEDRFPTLIPKFLTGQQFTTTPLIDTVKDKDLERAAALEEQQDEVGELARMMHFKNLVLAHILASARIDSIGYMGRHMGFYVQDIVDGSLVISNDYPKELGGSPTTYEEARRFTRPLVPEIAGCVERGLLRQALPHYGLATNLLSPDGSKAFEEVAAILLGDISTYEVFQNLKHAQVALSEAFDNEDRRRAFPNVNFAITAARQLLYERVLDIFSHADEPIHPKVEYRLKQLAIFAITGGISSKLYTEAGATENPYHELNKMGQSLADLKPYLNKIAAESGLIPPHLK